MAVIIKYNNEEIFDTLCETPLVSRKEDIVRTGQRLARADNFILTGKLKRTDVGCIGGFSEAYNLAKNLIIPLSVNFKKFEIIENGTTVFSHDNAIIESIDIDENRFFDLIPFSISLLCYQDSYSEIYGVVDPKEEFTYEDNINGTVNITHTISARGVNTSSVALDNARNFVRSLVGYSSTINPVGYDIDAVPVLLKKQESINRFTGEFSVVENYLFDKNLTSDNEKFVLSYSTDLSENDGIITVSIEGTLVGSIDSNISITRTGFSAINFYNIANAEYQTVGTGSLQTYPIAYSANENVDENSISFSYSYVNNTTTDPYVVDSITISRDGANHCISISLIIKSDIGCPEERMRKTKAYLAILDLDAYVAAKWEVYGTDKELGESYNSKSISFDNLTGYITIQCNKCSDSVESCGCLENLKYSVNIQPPIPQLSEGAAYAGEGCYTIQNLQYNNRGKISIVGSARPSKCCSNAAVKSQVYSRAHQLMAEYFEATDIILDGSQIEISQDKSVVSFTFSWNGIQPSSLSEDIFYATF